MTVHTSEMNEEEFRSLCYDFQKCGCFIYYNVGEPRTKTQLANTTRALRAILTPKQFKSLSRTASTLNWDLAVENRNRFSTEEERQRGLACRRDSEVAFRAEIDTIYNTIAL
jgi:hypothetical protein